MSPPKKQIISLADTSYRETVSKAIRDIEKKRQDVISTYIDRYLSDTGQELGDLELVVRGIHMRMNDEGFGALESSYYLRRRKIEDRLSYFEMLAHRMDRIYSELTACETFSTHPPDEQDDDEEDLAEYVGISRRDWDDLRTAIHDGAKAIRSGPYVSKE